MKLYHDYHKKAADCRIDAHHITKAIQHIKKNTDAEKQRIAILMQAAQVYDQMAAMEKR